jgi:hypothetical protein
VESSPLQVESVFSKNLKTGKLKVYVVIAEVGSGGNVSEFCSGDEWFESRPGQWPS